MTTSLTVNTTFTLTDAEYVTSKLGANLVNLHARYGRPDRELTENFVLEAALALRAGYLETVDYGFTSGDHWILRLRYRAVAGNGLTDCAPGTLPRAEIVADHPFLSVLQWNSTFTALTAAQQNAFLATLPFRRATGTAPTTQSGVYSGNVEYSRNGTGLAREIYRSA